MKHSVRTNTTFWLALVVIAVIGGGGCRQELKTGYGRAFGRDHTTSVNGTLVFREMVKGAGHDVDRYQKISPRWDQYQTVVWFPDGFRPPSPEAIEKIEQWLASGPDRTMLFVGRDYDAAMVYWDQLRQRAAADPGNAIEREFADAVASHWGSRNYTDARNCDWYNMVDHPFGRAKKLGGEIAAGIDARAADVRYGGLPTAGDVMSSGKFGDYRAEVLLTVDEIPMLYSLHRDDWPGSRLLVVGNGSFLLNLPLANEQNRLLAGNLIDCLDESHQPGGEVLFIESTDQIAISDSESPESFSKWSWITRKPLRYIVPNVLFWCLLLCFVYFPIFGRPRKIRRSSTANFRDHIHALAQLVRNTRRREMPQSWIDEYRRRTSNAKPTRDSKVAD